MRKIFIYNYQTVDRFIPEVETLAIRIGQFYQSVEFNHDLKHPLIIERRIISGEVGLKGNEVKDKQYDKKYSGPIFDEIHAERILDLICEFSFPDFLVQCHGGMSRAPSTGLAIYDIFGGRLYRHNKLWDLEGKDGVNSFRQSPILNRQYYDTLINMARKKGLI